MALQPRVASCHLVVALPRDAAEAAATLRWAQRVVAPGDALTLLHVRPADLTAPRPAGASPLAALAPLELPLDRLASDALAGADAEAAQAATQAAAALAQATGFEPRLLKLRTELRIADALLAFLAAGDAAQHAGRAPDALILGSHEAAATPEDPRRAKASRTSVEVATMSPLPVFVVRRGERAAGAGNGRWVAVAADGRAPASALLARWAARHVTRAGEAAVLVHVPPRSEAPDAAAQREASLAAAEDALRGGGAKVTLAPLATSFDARDALVDLAASGVAGGPPGAPDLLVLGTRGPAPLRRAALGSVAAYVVQHAPCALCLVPPPALAQMS